LVERFTDGLHDVLCSGIGSKARLKLDVADDLNVTVDSTEFETALVNLTLNARDPMPEGGEVTIKASNEVASNQVVITVSDTGVGIPNDIASKVFDPFFTTKAVGKSTGLGLSSINPAARSTSKPSWAKGRR
jgi:signal transduction histidine kinase